MAKKISRKQLLKEPDEFITFTGKMIRLVGTHQKKVFIALMAAVTLFLIFSMVRFFADRAENAAFTLLNQANNKYHDMSTNQDAVAALREVEDDFEFILKKYSGYQGGKIAGLVYADYLFQAGEYDRAAGLYLSALENFKKKPAYRNLILSGLGYSYKAREDFETSATYFEMIVASDIPLLKDEALFNLSTLYGLLGKDTKKHDALNAIISDYPESMYFELAKDRLSR